MHPACALDCAFNKCDAVFCDSCTSNHACRKKGMVLQSVTLDDDSDSDLSREVTVFMAVKYTMHSDGGYDDDEMKTGEKCKPEGWNTPMRFGMYKGNTYGFVIENRPK